VKLLFVVHRFGADIGGGAETMSRLLAGQLCGRGHDVHVLTSRARSHVDWRDHYPAGDERVDGVRVTRLSVGRRREDRLFGPMLDRVVARRARVPLHLQQEWMRLQGPYLPDLVPWLEDHGGDYDAVAFFTYLYDSTWRGLPAAGRVTSTLLHPTAHDEPTLTLPLFDLMFRLPDGFCFLSEEEAALVRGRFGVRRPSAITGIGVDLDVAPPAGGSFRDDFGIGDGPYLLYVGRIEPHKGSVELVDFFAAYKRRNPGPLKLVLVGDPVRPVPPHDEVIVTGLVSESTKQEAIDGCLAFVHPSYFESFSIVLCEAWARRRPAIVQGRSDVLRGMARRSGGGLPYVGFRQFEAAVDAVTADASLRTRLGRAGRSFVETHYDWPVVLRVYESLLDRTVATGPVRTR
jgi:glycosyltransferase involved in cell wall biosynthesis